MSNKRYEFQLDERLIIKLKQASKEHDMTVPEIIRQAIRQYIFTLNKTTHRLKKLNNK